MKNHLLTACMLFIAPFLVKSTPMDDKTYRDTLIFSPAADTKVIVIGDDLRTLCHYQKADSIKTLFLKDVAAAKQNKTFPDQSHEVHYFVAGNGKRRLKAESEDYVESAIDLEKEKRSMDLAVPPYAYVLHDLAEDVEIGIYVKDPEQLSALEQISFSEALHSIIDEKALLRKYSRISLEQKAGQWKPGDNLALGLDNLELSAVFGIGFIGNQVSPVLGGSLAITLNDKYHTPNMRFGASVSAMVLSDYANKEFTNLNTVTSYDASALFNLSDRKGSASMFGLRGGFLNAESGSTLDGAWKIGLASEGKYVNMYVDMIKTREKKTLFGVTLILPIQ
jgi:hypothetical protein